jgi:hypothetical protein
VEEVVEPVNLAKEMAARILQSPSEDQAAETQRTAPRSDDRPVPPQAKGAGGGKEDGARGDAQQETGQRPADDRRGPSPQAPQVEDQTLIELRQGFAAADQDDLDMGI